MNKFTILCLSLAAVSAVSGTAAVIEAGKSWLMGRRSHMPMSPESKVEYFTVDIVGDTLVNGLEAKKLVQKFVDSDVECTYVVREQDGLIQLLNETVDYGNGTGDFFNVMTLNLTNGQGIDRINYEENDETDKLLAKYIKTHNIEGQECREFEIVDEFSGDHISCWVENIGASWSDPYLSWMTLFPYVTGSRETFDGIFIVECCQNGKKIFGWRDFAVPVEDAGIKSVNLAEGKPHVTYDLQGRMVNNLEKRKIYLRGGRKVILL